jgi:hypothetical protein
VFRSIATHLRHNVVAYLALFLALGGVAWGAGRAPKNSVVTKSIKNRAVTEAKIRNGAVSAPKLGSDVSSRLGAQCPTGLTLIHENLCYEPTSRTPSNWFEANRTCGAAGSGIPTIPQLVEIMSSLTGTQTPEWTSDIWVSTASQAQLVGRDPTVVVFNIGFDTFSDTRPFRCVTTPH